MYVIVASCYKCMHVLAIIYGIMHYNYVSQYILIRTCYDLNVCILVAFNFHVRIIIFSFTLAFIMFDSQSCSNTAIIIFHYSFHLPLPLCLAVNVLCNCSGGKEWKRIRSAASKQIVPRRVASLTSSINELSQEFTDHLASVANRLGVVALLITSLKRL